jgi:pentapeptide repeat protein
MSTNDVLTLVIAALAVGVPAVAIMVSNNVDRRSARATLTDMTLRISQYTAKYEKLAEPAKWEPAQELETLVRQAEYLMGRLTVHFPRRKALFPESSVAATLAWALDQVNDFWWADKHWRTATNTTDSFLRATACSYWGQALCRRTDFRQARTVVTGALEQLPAMDADACIVNGDICLAMAQRDQAWAAEWVAKARNAYGGMPKSDGRYDTYLPGGKPWLNLGGADLANAQLRSTDLSGAGLGRANLAGADLAGADLTGADLTGADLTGADLTGADLTGADLTGAKLSETKLADAIVGETGPFPHGWERDTVSGRLTLALA